MNLQNLPNHGKLAKLVKRQFAAEYLKIILKQDYNANEVRGYAIIPNDTVLAERFHNSIQLHKEFRVAGGNAREALREKWATEADIHIQNVELFFEKKVGRKDPLRQQVKGVVFGTIYGRAAPSLAEELGITVEEAEALQQMFFKKFPKGARWIAKVHADGAEKFYAVNVFGGRRHLDGYRHAAKKVWKAMDRRGPNCVDLKTECLTAEGWKTVDQLRVGEQIYTKNAATGELELQPLRKVFRGHHKGKMWRLNKGIDGLVTPNHRWLVDWGKGGSDHKTHKSVFATSDDLANSGHNNPIHLVADGPIQQKGNVWTDDEISIVGWVLTDGHYEGGKRRVRIAQSARGNPHKVEMIDELMARVSATISRTGPDSLGKVTWTVPLALGDKIKAAMPTKVLTGKFLQGLSTHQLQLLYDAMMLGNGTFDKKRTIPVSFCAGAREKADMFAMLCVMLGIPCSVFHTKPARSKWQYASMENVPDPKKKCWQVQIKQRKFSQAITNRKQWVKFDGEVWCPNVENGTWVARRNGSVYITGNSLIQGPLSQVGYVAINRAERLLFKFETELFDKFKIVAPLCKHIGTMNAVHDSQEIETPLILAPFASYIAEHAATSCVARYFRDYGVHLNVDFEIEQEVGKNNAEMTALDGSVQSMREHLLPLCENAKQREDLLHNINVIWKVRKRELLADLEAREASRRKGRLPEPSTRMWLKVEDVAQLRMPDWNDLERNAHSRTIAPIEQETTDKRATPVETAKRRPIKPRPHNSSNRRPAKRVQRRSA